MGLSGAEAFFRKNDQSVLLVGFLVSCLFLPFTVWVFDHTSDFYRNLNDRYQKLKAASHATLSWTSFLISGWCLWMFGVILRDRKTFIDDYSYITRTLLLLYLIHAHSLSHRAKVSFARLLMLSLESAALLWGFYWSDVEPGVLFVLVNGPCVRSMLWITMFDVLTMEEINIDGVAVLGRPHHDDVAPYWFGAFGWSVFCLIGSAILLCVYMASNHSEITTTWMIVLPIYVFVHGILSTPFYHRFWRKGKDQQQVLENDGVGADRVDRIDFWLERDTDLQHTAIPKATLRSNVKI